MAAESIWKSTDKHLQTPIQNFTAIRQSFDWLTVKFKHKQILSLPKEYFHHMENILTETADDLRLKDDITKRQIFVPGKQQRRHFTIILLQLVYLFEHIDIGIRSHQIYVRHTSSPDLCWSWNTTQTPELKPEILPYSKPLT